MKLILFCFLLFVGIARADEPLWDDAQRAAERDCVIEGTVLSVDVVKAVGESENLMCAEIKILKVKKAHEQLGKETVKVFFVRSSDGAGKRCPAYANPQVKESAVFYLRYNEFTTGRKDFVIDIGSDVQPAAGNAVER